MNSNAVTNYAPLISAGASIVAIVIAIAGTWWNNRISHARGLQRLKDQQTRDDDLRREQQAREDQLRQERDARDDAAIRHRYTEWIEQQWWDKKQQAYSRIVEALWQLRRYPNAEVDHQFGIKQLSDETRREYLKYWNESREELQKATDIGAFVISNEAVEALARYFADTANPDDPGQAQSFFDEVETDLLAATACLQAIREIAKRDLELLGPRE